MHSYRAVHDTVMNIVCFALESNAALVPRSARKMARAEHRRQASTPSVAGSGFGTPLDTTVSVPASSASSVGVSPPRPAPLAIAEMAAGIQRGSVSSESVPGSPPPEALTGEAHLQDPDDFVLMDEAQVKHIQQMLEWTYGVELSPDVVIADANVGALAKRVLGARNLLDGATPGPTPATTAAPTGTATPVTADAPAPLATTPVA